MLGLQASNVFEACREEQERVNNARSLAETCLWGDMTYEVSLRGPNGDKTWHHYIKRRDDPGAFPLSLVAQGCSYGKETV